MASVILPLLMAANLVVPTERQLEWADCEVGVIIHHDIEVYQPEYDIGSPSNPPPARLFDPSALDTDQWLETAAAAGAKYAVLVAKHCSGFSLWPTKAHDYSVASSPWKGGKGDVVADFIASCKKYGIRPGLYASTGRNAYLKMTVDGKVLPPEEWKNYLQVVKTQLTELWTNYGELFEIWFDGGNLPADQGGREIDDILVRLQPKAIVFQGNPARSSCVRWIGNERAHAPEVCWSRTNCGTESTGVVEAQGEAYAGCRDGRHWCPGEADVPNRDALYGYLGGWFWRKGEDGAVFSGEQLLDKYMTSVGRNCNMLIGMVIDDRGRVPDADVAAFRDFGRCVKDLYANPVAFASGSGEAVNKWGWRRLEVSVPAEVRPSLMSVREDLTKGENVRNFSLGGFDGKTWRTLVSGVNIGHRRLERFRPGPYTRYRLDFWGIQGQTTPVIRSFELFGQSGSGTAAGSDR